MKYYCSERGYNYEVPDMTPAQENCHVCFMHPVTDAVPEPVKSGIISEETEKTAISIAVGVIAAAGSPPPGNDLNDGEKIDPPTTSELDPEQTQ